MPISRVAPPIGPLQVKTSLGLALSTSASLPQKKALVIFDTGSSDFVIDKSLPINNLNEPFDFSYINLHVYGDIYSDYVSISYGREVFDGDLAGGKFGLSFSTIQNSGFDVKQDPFVWAAEKQHLIQPSSFQFTFGHGGKASLNIGLFNSFKHSSLISWADKNSDKTFWRTSVELNKKQDSKRYRLNDCILGTPFMELGSVIFNFDLRRMGFAKAR